VPNPQQGANAAVAAAEAAFAVGIETHLIEVGNVNNGYAQALANAGVGSTSASWSSPNNLGALRAALDGLLASFGSCELTLDPAPAPGGESECEVLLDGQALELDGADGWSLVAPSRLRLEGAACEAYSQGAAVQMHCTCAGP
jgi:hypothetical protein